MARFVLQLCKLREDKFVPVKQDPLIVDSWESLCRLFDKDPRNRQDPGLRAFLVMDTSGYLGLLRGTGGSSSRVFHLWNRGKGNRVSWLIKKFPDFPSLLECVYFVQKVEWDATTVELGVQ